MGIVEYIQNLRTLEKFDFEIADISGLTVLLL